MARRVENYIKKSISIALIISFAMSDIAFAIEDISRATLAPPLSNDPLHDTDLKRYWSFIDISILIGQILKLNQTSNGLRRPKDILIPLIEKHLKDKKGKAYFDIQSIQEIREGDILTGFSLPVIQDGSRSTLIYSLSEEIAGPTWIPMGDGNKVYVKVASSSSVVSRSLIVDDTKSSLRGHEVPEAISKPKEENIEITIRPANTPGPAPIQDRTKATGREQGFVRRDIIQSLATATGMLFLVFTPIAYLIRRSNERQKQADAIESAKRSAEDAKIPSYPVELPPETISKKVAALNADDLAGQGALFFGRNGEYREVLAAAPGMRPPSGDGKQQEIYFLHRYNKAEFSRLVDKAIGRRDGENSYTREEIDALQIELDKKYKDTLGSKNAMPVDRRMADADTKEERLDILMSAVQGLVAAFLDPKNYPSKITFRELLGMHGMDYIFNDFPELSSFADILDEISEMVFYTDKESVAMRKRMASVNEQFLITHGFFASSGLLGHVLDRDFGQWLFRIRNSFEFRGNKVFVLEHLGSDSGLLTAYGFVEPDGYGSYQHASILEYQSEESELKLRQAIEGKKPYHRPLIVSPGSQKEFDRQMTLLLLRAAEEDEKIKRPGSIRSYMTFAAAIHEMAHMLTEKSGEVAPRLAELAYGGDPYIQSEEMMVETMDDSCSYDVIHMVTGYSASAYEVGRIGINRYHLNAIERFRAMSKTEIQMRAKELLKEEAPDIYESFESVEGQKFLRETFTAIRRRNMPDAAFEDQPLNISASLRLPDMDKETLTRWGIAAAMLDRMGNLGGEQTKISRRQLFTLNYNREEGPEDHSPASWPKTPEDHFPPNPYHHETNIDRDFRALDAGYANTISLEIERRLRRSQPGSPVRVLIIGVGRGFQVFDLMRRYEGYGGRLEISAIDKHDLLYRSPKALAARFKRAGQDVSDEIAARYIRTLRAGGRYLRCDMDHDSPGSDGTYDVVIFDTHVFEYIGNKLPALKNALRVCKKDGLVYSGMEMCGFYVSEYDAHLDAAKYFHKFGGRDELVFDSGGVRFGKGAIDTLDNFIEVSRSPNNMLGMGAVITTYQRKAPYSARGEDLTANHGLPILASSFEFFIPPYIAGLVRRAVDWWLRLHGIEGVDSSIVYRSSPIVKPAVSTINDRRLTMNGIPAIASTWSTDPHNISEPDYAEVDAPTDRDDEPDRPRLWLRITADEDSYVFKMLSRAESAFNDGRMDACFKEIMRILQIVIVNRKWESNIGAIRNLITTFAGEIDIEDSEIAECLWDIEKILRDHQSKQPHMRKLLRPYVARIVAIVQKRKEAEDSRQSSELAIAYDRNIYNDQDKQILIGLLRERRIIDDAFANIYKRPDLSSRDVEDVYVRYLSEGGFKRVYAVRMHLRGKPYPFRFLIKIVKEDVEISDSGYKYDMKYAGKLMEIAAKAREVDYSLHLPQGGLYGFDSGEKERIIYTEGFVPKVVREPSGELYGRIVVAAYIRYWKAFNKMLYLQDPKLPNVVIQKRGGFYKASIIDIDNVEYESTIGPSDLVWSFLLHGFGPDIIALGVIDALSPEEADDFMNSAAFVLNAIHDPSAKHLREFYEIVRGDPSMILPGNAINTDIPPISITVNGYPMKTKGAISLLDIMHDCYADVRNTKVIYNNSTISASTLQQKELILEGILIKDGDKISLLDDDNPIEIVVEPDILPGKAHTSGKSLNLPSKASSFEFFIPPYIAGLVRRAVDWWMRFNGIEEVSVGSGYWVVGSGKEKASAGKVFRAIPPMASTIVAPAILPKERYTLNDLKAIADIPTREAADALVEALIASNNYFEADKQVSIARLLEERKDTHISGPLIDVFLIKGRGVLKTVITVCRILGRIKAPEAVEPLARIAENSKWKTEVRIAAIEALGQIGDKKASEKLQKICETRDRHLLQASLMALGRIDTKKAKETILAICESGNRTIYTVLPFLGDLGVRAIMNSPKRTAIVFKYLASEYRVKGSLNFLITHRCPYRCAHCIVNDLIVSDPDRDIPLDDLKRIFRELDGFPSIYFTGGEPMMYGRKGVKENVPSDEFFVILTEACKYIKRVNIDTNGFFLPEDESELEAVLDRFPDNAVLTISLDRWHTEWADRMHKNLGAVVRGVESYTQRKKRLMIHYNIRLSNWPGSTADDRELEGILARYGLKKRYYPGDPTFFVNHVIGQGSAIGLSNIFVRTLQYVDVRKHSLPAEFMLFVRSDMRLVNCDHAAVTVDAISGTVLGDMKDMSVAEGVLNGVLSFLEKDHNSASNDSVEPFLLKLRDEIRKIYSGSLTSRGQHSYRKIPKNLPIKASSFEFNVSPVVASLARRVMDWWMRLHGIGDDKNNDINDLRPASGILYYPASGNDFGTIRGLVKALPNIDEFVFTDYIYGAAAAQDMERALKRIRGLEIINTEDNKWPDERRKIHITASFNGRRLGFYFYGQDARRLELPKKASVIVVKNPEPDLNTDLAWRARLISEQLKAEGWILAGATRIPTVDTAPSLIGLMRVRPYSGVLGYVSWLFGPFGEFVPYRKTAQIEKESIFEILSHFEQEPSLSAFVKRAMPSVTEIKKQTPDEAKNAIIRRTRRAKRRGTNFVEDVHYYTDFYGNYSRGIYDTLFDPAREEGLISYILMDKIRSNDRRLRVWSAGSSYGLELMTLVWLTERALKKLGEDPGEWQLDFAGTDESKDVLVEAENTKRLGAAHYLKDGRDIPAYIDTTRFNIDFYKVDHSNKSERDDWSLWQKSNGGFDIVFMRRTPSGLGIKEWAEDLVTPRGIIFGGSDRELADAVSEFVKDFLPYAFDEWEESPENTLAKGYGMCANKAKAMVKLLRGLGIKARFKVVKMERFAAFWDHLADILPDHRFGGQIAKLKANPYGDHVIVEVTFHDGRAKYYDPSFDQELDSIMGYDISGHLGTLKAPAIGEYEDLDTYTVSRPKTIDDGRGAFISACNMALDMMRRQWQGKKISGSPFPEEGKASNLYIWDNPDPRREYDEEFSQRILDAGAMLSESGIAHKTPLVLMKRLSGIAGKAVYLKDESAQEGGSFKIRGVAANIDEAVREWIDRITEEPALRNGPFYIVTQTDGNHGIATIAATRLIIKKYRDIYPELAEALNNIEPVVFGIDKMPGVKKDKALQALAEYRRMVGSGSKGILKLDYPDYAQAHKAREDFIAAHRENSRYMEHGGMTIMAGHGSAGLEIDEQLRDLGIDTDKKVTILVPVGAGGPIGIGAALKLKRPNVQVIFVQTRTYATLIRSLKAGKTLPNGDAPKPTAYIPAADGDMKPIVFEDGIAVDVLEEDARRVAERVFDAGVAVDPKRSLNVCAPIMWQDLADIYGSEDASVGGTTSATGEALLEFHQTLDALKSADVIVLFGTEGNIDPDVTNYIKGMAASSIVNNPSLIVNKGQESVSTHNDIALTQTTRADGTSSIELRDKPSPMDAGWPDRKRAKPEERKTYFDRARIPKGLKNLSADITRGFPKEALDTGKLTTIVGEELYKLPADQVEAIRIAYGIQTEMAIASGDKIYRQIARAHNAFEPEKYISADEARTLLEEGLNELRRRMALRFQPLAHPDRIGTASPSEPAKPKKSPTISSPPRQAGETIKALERSGGNITAAGKLLGLSRQAISRRIDNIKAYATIHDDAMLKRLTMALSQYPSYTEHTIHYLEVAKGRKKDAARILGISTPSLADRLEHITDIATQNNDTAMLDRIAKALSPSSTKPSITQTTRADGTTSIELRDKPPAGMTKHLKNEWITGLYDLERSKEAFIRYLKKKGSINIWRLQASLAALTKEDRHAFKEWANTLTLNEDTLDPKFKIWGPNSENANGIKFILPSAKEITARFITRGSHMCYMPAMELWESLQTVHDPDDTPYFRQKIFARVLTVAERHAIVAHGTANDEIENMGSMARYRLRNEWALLNIMIEGNIRKGEHNYFEDAWHSRSPARYGPYFVLFGKNSGPRHAIYLVPHDDAGRFLNEGIDEAVRLKFMTPKNAAIAKSKIMTYQQFVDCEANLDDILAGKLSPADAIMDPAHRAGGEDRLEAISRAVNLYFTDEVKSLIEEILSRDIDKIMVVGDSLKKLPFFLAALGKDVVYVDYHSVSYSTQKNRWIEFKDKLVAAGLGPGMHDIKFVNDEMGVLDYNEHGIEPGTFDLVAMIDLACDPVGSPRDWLSQAKELLKPEGYLVVDEADWSGINKGEPIYPYLDDIFPKREAILENITGSYPSVEPYNTLYRISQDAQLVTNPDYRAGGLGSETASPSFGEETPGSSLRASSKGASEAISVPNSKETPAEALEKLIKDYLTGNKVIAEEKERVFNTPSYSKSFIEHQRSMFPKIIVLPAVKKLFLELENTSFTDDFIREEADKIILELKKNTHFGSTLLYGALLDLLTAILNDISILEDVPNIPEDKIALIRNDLIKFTRQFYILCRAAEILSGYSEADKTERERLRQIALSEIASSLTPFAPRNDVKPSEPAPQASDNIADSLLGPARKALDEGNYEDAFNKAILAGRVAFLTRDGYPSSVGNAREIVESALKELGVAISIDEKGIGEELSSKIQAEERAIKEKALPFVHKAEIERLNRPGTAQITKAYDPDVKEFSTDSGGEESGFEYWEKPLKIASILRTYLEKIKPEVLSRTSKGKVLLIGPGRKELFEVLVLLELFPKMRSLTIIDSSMQNIIAIKKMLDARPDIDGSRIELRHEDMAKLSSGEGEFDICFSRHVFDNSLFRGFGHETITKWITELKRVLKPNGIYITPYSDIEFFKDGGFEIRGDTDRGAFVASLDKSIFDTNNERLTTNDELDAAKISAERFKDAMEFLRDKVNNKEPVVFAMGTDWMKDYTKGGELYKEMNSLVSATRTFCASHGVTLITVPDSELLKEINGEMGKTKNSGAKVVAVGTVRKEDMDKPSQLDAILDKYKDATVIGIEDVQLEDKHYLSRFIEVLHAAMSVAFPATPYIDNSHIKIDRSRKFPVLIPDAEPIPQEELERFKQFYIVQRNA